jgi:hypothetical protein
MVWIAFAIIEDGAVATPAPAPTATRDSGGDAAATGVGAVDGAVADFSLAFCAVGAESEVAPLTTIPLSSTGTDSVSVTVSPGATS